MKTLAELAVVCDRVAIQLRDQTADRHSLANAAMTLMVVAHDLERLAEMTIADGWTRETRLARAALKMMRDRTYRLHDCYDDISDAEFRREVEAALRDARTALTLERRVLPATA